MFSLSVFLNKICIMKNLLFLFFSFLIINSCGGSTEDMLVVNQITPIDTQGKLLKQIKVTEPGVFVNYITYHYTGTKLISIDSGNNSFSFNLQYSGDQISVINQTYGNGIDLITRKSTLHYTNGKLTTIDGTENSLSGDYVFLTTITYNGDKPSTVEKFFSYIGGNVFYKESGVLEFTGNNLTKFTSTFGYSSYYTTVTNYSNFDNSPNIFNTLPFVFNLSNSFRNKEDFSVIGLSVNNHRTLTNEISTENINYTYGANGYPTKAVKPGITYEYTYINL